MIFWSLYREKNFISEQGSYGREVIFCMGYLELENLV